MSRLKLTPPASGLVSASPASGFPSGTSTATSAAGASPVRSTAASAPVAAVEPQPASRTAPSAQVVIRSCRTTLFFAEPGPAATVRRAEVPMTHWFQLGGFPMWFTLVFGVLSIAASLRYAARPERRLVPLTISLGMMTLLNGAFGFVAGLIMSLNGLPKAAAAERWIWMVGLGESLVNIAFALALVGLATLAMVIGTWRLSRPTTA